MWSRALAAAVLISSVSADYDVSFLVTREVRGAIFPVDQYGTECSLARVSQGDCGCFGGAARRATIINSATSVLGGTSDHNTITVEAGAYFAGSGTFFAAFDGNASAHFFAAAAYDAYSINFRDISTPNMHGLASYLSHVRALAPSTWKPAVITNYNRTGDALLGDFIQEYELLPLSNGRTLAILGLADPTHLYSTAPAFAARLSDYWRSLATTLATLRRLPSANRPDVIAVVVSAVPVTSAQIHAAGSHQAATDAALHQLVDEAIGVDIFILATFDTAQAAPHVRYNWAGDAVLIVPARRTVGELLTWGKGIDNITARFTNEGLLVPEASGAQALSLDCSVAEAQGQQAAITSSMYSFHADKVTRMAVSVGSLTRALDSEIRAAPSGATSQPGTGGAPYGCAVLGGQTACGCCVGACQQGAFVADAIAYVAGTDFALVNAGAIRGQLPSGAVSVGEINQMVPFANEIVRMSVTGATLRTALENSISRLGDADAATLPDRRFAQVAGLQYEWYLLGTTPHLARVTAAEPHSNGVYLPLNDTRVYTIAMPDYVAGGGDGYSMFEAVQGHEYVGPLLAGVVTSYLEAGYQGIAGDVTSSLDEDEVRRIHQQEDLVVIQVGILCKTGTIGSAGMRDSEREECDHMHHVAMMINDKHDGFYDDILPSVRLDLAEANVGCVNQRGAAAVAQLQAALPQMVAAIGVGCSSDVMDISNVDFRAQASFDAVVVSGSSTAPAIADETSYPNVARMATGEGPGGGPGHAALAAHYAWTKVAVLSTDSGWAIGASAAFTEAFTATPGNVVLNEGDSLTQAFSIDALDNNPDSNGPIVAMLERLISLNTRIVYLCAEPRIQERIFRTVYQTGLMYGEGFAWIIGWVTEVALTLDGAVSPDAVRGIEGAFGMLESFGTGTPSFDDYNSRWLTVSSTVGCDRVVPYCDVDGSPTANPAGYSMGMAEGIMLVAQAFDRRDNFRDTNMASGGNPDGLYAAMLDVTCSPVGYTGPSGSVVLDGFGDRMGKYNILNMQLQSGRRRKLSDWVRSPRRAFTDWLADGTGFGADADEEHVLPRFRRQLLVPLSSSSAGYMEVGDWTPGDDAPTIDGAMVFPGNVRTVPSDTPPSTSSVDVTAAIVTVVVVCVVLALLIFGVQRRRQAVVVGRQKKLTASAQRAADTHKAAAEAAKKELDQFKDAMSGVRSASRAFNPGNLLARRSSVGSASASTSSTRVMASPEPTVAMAVAAPPPARRQWAMWYWHEDAGRISAHDPSQVIKHNEKHYVRYANAVSSSVEKDYQRWTSLPAAQRAGKAVVPLDLTGMISSTGTEQKAHGQDSGTIFEIDFVKMVQRNAKTRFERPLHRVEAPKEAGEEAASATAADLEPRLAMLRRELHLYGDAAKVAKEAAAKLGVQTRAGQSTEEVVDLCIELLGVSSSPSNRSTPREGVVGGLLGALDSITGGGVGMLAGAVGLSDPAPPPLAVQFSGSIPAELMEEDMLLLYPGQLLQTSKTRGDGWAYGNIMLDVVENRPNPGIDGISVSSGWFPLSCTAIANANQLQKLQKQMGDGAANALAPPKYWEPVKDPMQAEKFMLPEGAEKRKAVDHFLSTLPPSIKVVDVQRVQNISMWQSYAVKRQTVLAREKDKHKASRFERVWLFHGTDEDTVPKITQQGFNRSFCGRNATMFGKGVYFARDASYSSSRTYSRPNAQGIQHMFLCRVTVGEFCMGVKDAITPAVRQGNILHDCTVNSMSDPSIYVTYHDAQAYPEYLVRFKQ